LNWSLMLSHRTTTQSTNVSRFLWNNRTQMVAGTGVEPIIYTLWGYNDSPKETLWVSVRFSVSLSRNKFKDLLISIDHKQ
jgi:hypothetical protein